MIKVWGRGLAIWLLGKEISITPTSEVIILTKASGFWASSRFENLEIEETCHNHIIYLSDRLDGGTTHANQETEKESEKIKKALIREGEGKKSRSASCCHRDIH